MRWAALAETVEVEIGLGSEWESGDVGSERRILRFDRTDGTDYPPDCPRPVSFKGFLPTLPFICLSPPRCMFYVAHLQIFCPASRIRQPGLSIRNGARRPSCVIFAYRISAWSSPRHRRKFVATPVAVEINFMYFHIFTYIISAPRAAWGF